MTIRFLGGAGGSGGVDLVGEGHITILPHAARDAPQGTWTFHPLPGSGFFLNGYLYNSTHANGDRVNYNVFLDAGTYTINVLGRLGSDAGIMEVLMDGISLGMYDWFYVFSDQTWISFLGINTTKGLKTLSLKVNGKNPLSSDHFLGICSISLWRTA